MKPEAGVVADRRSTRPLDWTSCVLLAWAQEPGSVLQMEVELGPEVAPRTARERPRNDPAVSP